MSPEDAEEYTQSLGQIVAGSWRQIAWARRQGVPEALGLTTEQWVKERLGGYVSLAIPERREAVRELLAPVEEGGEGLSTREAASVLGVSKSTVADDAAPVQKWTADPVLSREATAAPVQKWTADPMSDDDHDEAPPVRVLVAAPSGEPETKLSHENGFAFADPIKETDEEKAYYHLAKVAVWSKLDATDVASVCADPGAYLHTFEAFQQWITQFVGALRARRASPLRAVK